MASGSAVVAVVVVIIGGEGGPCATSSTNRVSRSAFRYSRVVVPVVSDPNSAIPGRPSIAAAAALLFFRCDNRISGERSAYLLIALAVYGASVVSCVIVLQ